MDRLFPIWVNVVAFVFILLGYSLTILSLWKNRFFSTTVRIQKERGHYVIDKGPYAFIRHPGYAGLIVFFWLSDCVELSLGVDSYRIVYDCFYLSNLFGGCYPPEGVVGLCRLCRKGKISIDPENMVEIYIANIFRLTLQRMADSPR